MTQPENGAPTAAPWTPSLSFDAWAELSARLLGLDAEASAGILEREKIDPGAWAECDQHYSRAIVDDVAHGRMERAKGYGQRCVAEMSRRRASADASPPDQAGSAVAPEARDDGVPMEVGAPLEGGPTAVPSFLQQPFGPSPAATVPGSDGATTAAVFDLPSALRAGALPFTKSAAPSLVSLPAETRPLPPPASPGATQVFGATAPVSPDAVLKAALPFAGTARPQAPTFPRLPLPTYASLCAELSVFPEHKADIRKRYGIETDEAHSALDELWRGRLEASEAVRAEWQALVARQVESLPRSVR